jgi:hypothetical protein
MYNISKYYGIPASYKTALKDIKTIAKEETEKYHNSGYLAIMKRKYRGGYRGFVIAYPIFYFATTPVRKDVLKLVKI